VADRSVSVPMTFIEKLDERGQFFRWISLIRLVRLTKNDQILQWMDIFLGVIYIHTARGGA